VVSFSGRFSWLFRIGGYNTIFLDLEIERRSVSYMEDGESINANSLPHSDHLNDHDDYGMDVNDDDLQVELNLKFRFTRVSRISKI
jgi:hypothetical protein